MIPFLDLTRQIKTLRPELTRAVQRVLDSGAFILGREVQQFETEFTRFCRAKHAVGVASGTDALELSLCVAGVGPGDLVATVSFTFFATTDAILHVGAQPLFVDIDPATYTLDPSDLKRRLQGLKSSERARVKAVIPVHLYGYPCDMDRIRRVAKEYRLTVVEDAAQAAGAAWRGRPAGSLGDFGCFSFFPSKNLGAFGDGGMVVTGSRRWAQQLRSLRNHGRRPDGTEGALGRNSRLDELQAAILRVKLRVLPRWIRRRKVLAHAYTNRLSNLPGLRCPEVLPGAGHAFHLYVIRTKRRAILQKALLRQGIETRVYYGLPVHRQPLHRFRAAKLLLPETERAAREVLALPLFPEMTDREQERVCQSIEKAIRG